jgi:Predicted glycosyltransferases
MNVIAFVILHYETTNDTRDCLASLMKYMQDNVYIIIVDNGSVVGKLDSLKEEYKNIENIVFLRSETNQGFAKGNNIGFCYAKDKLKADYIILTNSDTIFEQEDFVKTMVEAQLKYHFDVAGPQIISMADGKNQNPVQVMYQNLSDLRKRLLKYRILYITSYFNIDLLIKKFLSKEITEVNIDKVHDYQLHGACMIFGPQYIKSYDGLYPKTFMYGEESILKYIADRDQLTMKYIEELSVYHKEGSSTDSVYGKGRKKRQFYYKWNIDSCKILGTLMRKKSNYLKRIGYYLGKIDRVKIKKLWYLIRTGNFKKIKSYLHTPSVKELIPSDMPVASFEILTYIQNNVQWIRKNKKVLFVAEYISFASRYRVEHFREQLLIQGVDTDFIMVDHLADQTINYDAVVFYRLRFHSKVEGFVKQCHRDGIKVYYDIDDFIFEYAKIKHLEFLKGIDYVDFANDSKRVKRCMNLCDGFITSTENMKTAIKDSFPDKPVVINRNVASMEMAVLSSMAEKGKAKDNGKIILGYFSGSKTHDKDFETISNVILRLFKKYDNLYLKTVGVLDVGDEFKEFRNRMIHVDFVNWRELPKLIASVDINLMPLEDTFFHACKSENKWMEAAFVSVPTVASWNEELDRMIQNDVTGYLCKTETEWFDILSKLIESFDLRSRIASTANDFVLENCITTKTGVEAMNFILERQN